MLHETNAGMCNDMLHETIFNATLKIWSTMLQVFTGIAFKNLQRVATTKYCAKHCPDDCAMLHNIYF